MILRDYQEMSVEAVRDSYRAGKRRTLLVLPTGGGKCLGRGTPILMYDGSIKPVEDIVVGDAIMGPDSKPRHVTSTTTGREELFRVTPKKGDPYVVNRSHILSLRITPTNRSEYTTCGDSRYTDRDIANVSVEDYLLAPGNFKHRAKGWRAAVDFPSKPLPPELPPYILGVWLGDGSSRTPSITSIDDEIIDEWKAHGQALGLQVRTSISSGRCPEYFLTTGKKGPGRGHRSNPFLSALHAFDLVSNKHVPECYKANSREVRLQILAGLIDTDGSLARTGYDIISVREILADDICFIARSLGFAAYKRKCRKTCTNNGVTGTYWRVSISGDVGEVPVRLPRKMAPQRMQKKSVLDVGISLESIGEGDYYGFEVSGPDRLFLLGDFTVTHNTVCFSYIAAGVAQNNKRVLIIAHRRELLKQISKALTSVGVPHGMLLGGSTGIPRANVVVASVFTLANRLKHFPEPDMIIGDEAHHFTPDSSWGKVVAAFPKARVLGVTATPERLDGKGLGVLFDDMVIGPTVAELTEQEYLSPADVYAPSKPEMKGVHSRMGDYVKAELEQVMDKPSITGSAVAHYTKLAAGKKAIAFCVSVKHAQVVAEDFRNSGYASYHIDGGMTEAERDKVLKDFEGGKIQVLTSCDLVSEGFDLPAVEVAILLRPTQSLSLYLQQCLDSETEILTQRGWIGHADITDDDIIASKDMEDGAIKWSAVRSITRRPLADGEKMFSIESPHLNVRVTGGHDMISRARGARAWSKEEAALTAQRKGMYQIPVSGIMDVPDASITDDELRLLGWFLSDGSRNRITNAIYIAQSEGKPEHLSSIQSCIEGCGIKYGRYVAKRKGDYAKYAGSVMFTMSFGKPRGRDSHLKGYGHLGAWLDKSIPGIYDTLSARQLRVLLETLNLGDGSNMHQPKGWVRRTMSITTGDNEHMADRLQAILVTRGFRCNKGKSATVGKKPQFFLYINDSEVASIAGMNVKDGVVGGKRPYKRSRFVECEGTPGETVWCVETDYGTLISRRRGKVAILGNCGRAIRPAPGKTKTIILDHAGNTARHGFIDEPRDWTLDQDIIKKRRAEAKEKPPEVRTCPECFAMHATLPVCPKCGHVYKIKGRQIMQVDGELVQLSHAHEARAAAEETDWKRRFDVLAMVGRKRGYKSPHKWAFNVICGQEATRLAKLRNANQTTNGLTSEERQRIWAMTMGKMARA